MRFFFYLGCAFAALALNSCADILRKSDASACGEVIQQALDTRLTQEKAKHRQSFAHQKLDAKLVLRVVWLQSPQAAILSLDRWKEKSANPDFNRLLERTVSGLSLDTKALEGRSCIETYPWRVRVL